MLGLPGRMSHLQMFHLKVIIQQKETIVFFRAGSSDKEDNKVVFYMKI